MSLDSFFGDPDARFAELDARQLADEDAVLQYYAAAAAGAQAGLAGAAKPRPGTPAARRDFESDDDMQAVLLGATLYAFLFTLAGQITAALADFSIVGKLYVVLCWAFFSGLVVTLYHEDSDGSGRANGVCTAFLQSVVSSACLCMLGAETLPLGFIFQLLLLQMIAGIGGVVVGLKQTTDRWCGKALW